MKWTKAKCGEGEEKFWRHENVVRSWRKKIRPSRKRRNERKKKRQKRKRGEQEESEE